MQSSLSFQSIDFAMEMLNVTKFTYFTVFLQVEIAAANGMSLVSL